METNSYFYHYLFIFIFVLFALVFPVLPIILAYFVAPKKPSAIKNASYECGLQAEGDPWIQFRVQYYIFALVFLIFDIETIFIYPWAVAFRQLGLFAFVEMVIFIGILALALVYAWRKNALEWE
ncbi:MAG: NADH-quinone oxidoreductase subunit A [Candidatus Omnitrophica bacterium]|nr:NADH-quinone oxidoreductase subunit A [Candidatus Omnitrophota bacterium]